jgi:hypothetical protein
VSRPASHTFVAVLTAILPMALAFVALSACGSSRVSTGETDGGRPEDLDAGAAHRDAAPNATQHGDDAGKGDAAGSPCGTTTCVGGQVCVAGACEYSACVGAHVPGDYATVQSGVNAMGATGGTLCVGEGTFAEAVSIDANGLTIQGVSAQKTKVRSLDARASSQNGLVVRGLAATEPSSVHAGKIEIENCSLSSTSNTPGASALQAHLGGDLDGPLALTVRHTKITATHTAVSVGSTGADVLLDAVDLSGGSGLTAGPATDEPDSVQGIITIQNSYIHDCTQVGVGVRLPAGILKMFNNTLVGNHEGVWIASSSSEPRFSFVGNIVAGGGVGARVQAPFALDSHNAFFGNQTNYEGLAKDGTGYVKSDCKLVAGTVAPSLGSGSPCRNAGDPASAPARDYWDAVRPSPPSIGAVEQ